MASTSKPPSQKVIQSFFKSIRLDLAPKVTADLEQGLDPNVMLDIPGYGGATTALMHALRFARTASIRVLLDAGADVKAAGRGGGTPLHEIADSREFLRAKAGDLAMAFATELVERGADVSAKDTSGQTPLHAAAEADNVKLAELLLARGAGADVEDGRGQTPYAVTSSAEIRALLKQHGAKGFGPGGGKVITPTVGKATWKDVEVDRGAIGCDREGNLWFGTNVLFRFDGKELTRYEFEETFSVGSIAAGPPSILYLATNWGLIRLAGGTFTLFSSENSELFDSHIVIMRTSPDGRPHIVSYESEAEEKHISVFDGESFSLLSPGKDFPKGLEIECLAWDTEGALMIGSSDHGIAIQRGTGPADWKRLDKFDPDRGPPGIDQIVVDDEGVLWVATGRFGLWEARNDGFVRHDVESADVVCRDGDTTWIGGRAGLYRLDRDGKLTLFKQGDSPLPDDDVGDLVRAPDGTVWIYAGADIARARNGALERMSGAEPAKAAPEKKAKPRKLLPFPTKPLVPRAKVPKPVVAAIEKAKLESLKPDRLLDLLRPAIAFDLVANPSRSKPLPVGASKFGGKPDLPAAMKWPAYAGDNDRLLPFVLQFNLAADVHAMDKESLLPAKGMLYFFSDTSPDELEDARVLYTDLAPAKLARRDFPEDLVDRKDEVDFVAQLPEYKLELFSVFTLPSIDFLRARAETTEDDAETLNELKEALVRLANKKLPAECSRLLGWPDSVQGEVTTKTDTIALLQLNGFGLSPKGIEKVFQHWSSDGLIHFVIAAKALAERKLQRAKASMAYT